MSIFDPSTIFKPSDDLRVARNPPTQLVVASVRQLWSKIDVVHASVQKLQSILNNIDYTPSGFDSDARALEQYRLLAVRIDTRLVDVVNLIHGLLPNWFDPASELGALRTKSKLRVRKCLKLTA